jgi:exonuclease III
VDVLMRRKVNIFCVPETKWKGKKAKEIGEDYEIIYSGRTGTRNGIGVLLNEEMKSKVVDVGRKGIELFR